MVALEMNFSLQPGPASGRFTMFHRLPAWAAARTESTDDWREEGKKDEFSTQKQGLAEASLWLLSIKDAGFSHGFHMVFTWFSHGFHMVSHGFHMVFTWFSHGFHMVFTCFNSIKTYQNRYFAYEKRGVDHLI